MNTVITKNYTEPEFNKKEIMRYLGMTQEDKAMTELICECIKECKNAFSYKLCYSVFDINIDCDEITFPFSTIKSNLLAKHIKDAAKAVIFAGTVGIGIDRLIAKYSVIAPSKAVVFQEIGAERIEALCDLFCNELKKEYAEVKSRFSPGYGDLSLDFQKDILNVLSATKNIGLSLNSGMLMSPTKSVTAIVGIK